MPSNNNPPVTGDTLPDYRAESCVIENLEAIKHAWNNLQARADCSYFQSWGWVGLWLEQMAYDLEPVLVKLWYGELLVGMGIFVNTPLTRHRVFHSNAVFLNEYPLSGRNMTIEYNGLLADKDHKQAVYREIINYLLVHFKKSDEFFFSGLSETMDAKLLQASHDDKQSHVKILEQSLAWSVALDTLEPGINGVLKTLSKNRRTQLRRSLKAYQQQGPLLLEEARSREQALQFFDGLKQLHTQRWRLKGGDGAFANPRWEKFHRALITARFGAGEVQLLRVTNAVGTIGYLYSFIWRQRVYVLQTGFKMTQDKHLLPGYVVHVLAMAHHQQQGMEVYDLMHGDALYKRILCQQGQSLYWLVIQRKRLKYFVEDCSRSVFRYFTSGKY